MTKVRTEHPPVTGLLKLTQNQVKKLDAVIAQACELSAGREVEIKIIVKDGIPRFVRQVIVMEALKP